MEKVILIEAIIFQSIECYWTDAVPAINEPFYGDVILSSFRLHESFIPLIDSLCRSLGFLEIGVIDIKRQLNSSDSMHVI